MKFDLSLCNLVTKAARVVQRQYQEAVMPYGVTAPQAGLLYFLSLSGPCSQAELARMVKLDRATVNAMVRKLSDRGFLSTAPDSGDRRKDIVCLEASGLALIPRLVEIDRRMGETFEALAGSSSGQIRRFLEALVFDPSGEPEGDD